MVTQKERLRKFINGATGVNITLLFRGVFIMVVCGYIGIGGLNLVNDRANDLKHNIAYQWEGVNAVETRPTPCGVTAPDALHLRQALGVDNVYGSVLEMFVLPNYEQYSQYTDDALCGRTYGSWNSQTGDAVKFERTDVAAPVTGDINIGEQLFAISKYMDRGNQPGETTTDSFSSVRLALKNELCRHDDDRWYPDLKRDSYGALTERVAKAYIAAAPTFFRYQTWFDTDTTAGIKDEKGEDIASKRSDLGCLGTLNPFVGDGALGGDDVGCRTERHINEVLKEAGSPRALARMVNAMEGTTLLTTDGLPQTSEMIYALLALSVIGYMDRSHNDGKCFRNSYNSGETKRNPTQFCDDVIGSPDFAAFSLDTVQKASAHYTSAQDNVAKKRSCTGDAIDVGSIHTTERHYDSSSTNDVATAVKAACSNNLQYGLFDQIRLFGIPDVARPFVVDPRPEASLREVASWFYKPWYVDARDGSLFNDPKARLELFLAYRVASASIVACAAAAFTGYFLTRATRPLLSQTFAITGLQKDRFGLKPFLIAPKPDKEPEMLLAAGLGFVIGFWILLVDPSVEAIFPVTDNCEDWAGSDFWTPSGTYVTNWTKRSWQFVLLREAGIAVLIMLVSIFPLIYYILKSFNALLNRRQGEGQTLWRHRRVGFYAIALMIMLVGLAALVSIPIDTGNVWHDRIRMGADTTKVANALANDCIAAVWSFFWIGAGLGWFRARWSISYAGFAIKLLTGLPGPFFLFVPFIQIPDIIGKELWDTGIIEYEDVTNQETGLPYKKPINDDSWRNNLKNVFVAILVFTALLCAFMTINHARRAQPGPTPKDPEQLLEDARDKAKAQYQAENEPNPNYDEVLGLEENVVAPFLSPEVKRLMEMKVLQPMPIHDATGTTGSNVLSQRAFGSYKITGANGVQQTRYSPMLRVATTF